MAEMEQFIKEKLSQKRMSNSTSIWHRNDQSTQEASYISLKPKNEGSSKSRPVFPERFVANLASKR